MIDSKLVTGTLNTTVGLLLMGGICLLPLTILAQTVSTPRNTAQHSLLLENEGQSDSEIDQRSKQKAQEPVSTKISDSVNEITIENNSSLLDWEVQAASQDWFNLNLGDGSKDIVQTVILRF